MDGSPYLRGSRRIQHRGLDIVRDGDVFAGDTVTVEDKWRESKGTLLTNRNNLVPASEPWLADHERSTFRQARLNRLGSQRTQSHDADARCGIEPFRPYPMQIRIALPGISSNSTTSPVPPFFAQVPE